MFIVDAPKKVKKKEKKVRLSLDKTPFIAYCISMIRKTKAQALARWRASQHQPKSKGNPVLAFVLSTLKNR